MDLPGIRKNITFSIYFIFIPVLLSGSFYLFFRTSNTVIYQVTQGLFPSGNLQQLRTVIQNIFSSLPEWTIYSLPGGLWVFSFANFSFLLLNEKTKYLFKYIILSLFGIVTALEILQKIHLTDGRFDLTDLILYFAAALTSTLLIRSRIRKLKHQPILKNDKSPVYALALMICIFCATLYLADVVL